MCGIMAQNAFDVLFLSEQDVERCITYPAGIAVIEETCVKVYNGEAVQERTFLPAGKGIFHHSKGCIPGSLFTYVITSVFPENPAKYGLRTNSAGLFVLCDPETGLIKAIISGAGLIRAIKTGGASTVAAKYLAKRGSSTLAFIGAGNQAVYHLLAMKEAFKIAEVRTFDISPAAQRNFEQTVSPFGIKVQAFDSIPKAVQGADIVVTLTTADAPLLKAEWLEKGMLVLKVGSFQELEPELLLKADKLVVDWWENVKKRSKEIKALLQADKITEDDIAHKRIVYAELPEVVAGKKAGRTDPDEIILSIQYGFPACWASLTSHVYNQALSSGIGRKINLLSGV